MGFLDKAKAAAEQATTKAKEKAGDMQTKKRARPVLRRARPRESRLAEAGEVSSPTLDPLVEKIRSLEAQLDEGEEHGGGDGIVRDAWLGHIGLGRAAG